MLVTMLQRECGNAVSSGSLQVCMRRMQSAFMEEEERVEERRKRSL